MGLRQLEIFVIHHRTPTVLAACLELLAEHADGVPVTVLDTALDPSLPQQLESSHPRLSWKAVPNHSYAHAVNLALRHGRSPWLLVMNADVYLGPHTLADLWLPFEDASVALAGPVNLRPDGRPQDLGLPYRRHLMRLRWRAAQAPAPHLAHRPPWVPVPWLAASLLMVRREAALQAGGMDGSLRFYNEDLEWGLRLRAAGWRNALVATEVTHLGGAATPSEGRFLIEGLRGGYALSRRYLAKPLRLAHRVAIAAYATLAARWGRAPERRATWAEVARRFRSGELDQSPFGPTLGEGWAPPGRGRPASGSAGPAGPQRPDRPAG